MESDLKTTLEQWILNHRHTDDHVHFYFDKDTDPNELLKLIYNEFDGMQECHLTDANISLGAHEFRCTIRRMLNAEKVVYEKDYDYIPDNLELLEQIAQACGVEFEYTSPILPCPFCGGRVAVEAVDGKDHLRYRVACDNAWCAVQPHTEAYPERQDAILNWNNRPSTPKVRMREF